MRLTDTNLVILDFYIIFIKIILYLQTNSRQSRITSQAFLFCLSTTSTIYFFESQKNTHYKVLASLLSRNGHEIIDGNF